MVARVVQRLLDAEDLVRRRRADEHRRHVASQRSARVDPNPHQIDAVIFALSRIPEGGCILADEVGLGKTIEAGLVVAQLLAEGARRILIVTPKALLGQWTQELYALFGIEAHEVTRDLDFGGDGVFLVTRDVVGGDAGAAALRASERFDLCVIDEAHEVFAGIYRRYDRSGSVREDSPYARMASRLLTAIQEAATPVLLLTATPIQNSLLELWGLVHYVDPTGTLLGDLGTFRQLFCPSDDRILEQGQAHELQRRLGTVLQRTLRRQAQDFMREPFVGRQARLFEYVMSPEERELYDDVTRYLLEPNLQAFQGSQRQLLLLGFHKRMASSLPALAKSLERVAERLRALRDRGTSDDDGDRSSVLDDLEDDSDDSADVTVSPPVDRERAAAELARVESFIRRAESLPTDSKARALLQAVHLVFEQADRGRSSRKVVVFTESLTTQDYLRQLLIESQLVRADEITLFRGVNDSPSSRRALDTWLEEVGRKLPPDSRPSTDVAIRLALVHEFRHRSTVMICTEAGAKGLNLQFCNTVINYDLPWNPQRIEQRIGRCHRYGQKRDVTVINFIAKDNEAQRLTFDILSQKLELFGTVLGASDEILHEAGAGTTDSLASALGTEFESQLRRIYDRARTIEEVESELRALRENMEVKRRDFESAQKRTEDVIQRRFDATVKQAFRSIQQQLPAELEAFDRHMQRVVTSYLDDNGIEYSTAQEEDALVVSVAPSLTLPDPLREGTRCAIGNVKPGSANTPLHLGHALVTAAIQDARRRASDGPFRLRVEDERFRNRTGRLRVLRVLYRGLETSESVIPVIVLDGDDAALDVGVAVDLLDRSVSTRATGPDSAATATQSLDDAAEQLIYRHTSDASAHARERFERTIGQIERSLEDRILLLERRRDAAFAKLRRAMDTRDAAVGAEQRNRADSAVLKTQEEIDRLDSEIATLRAGDDEAYQRWRERTHDRYFSQPETTTLFEAELELV